MKFKHIRWLGYTLLLIGFLAVCWWGGGKLSRPDGITDHRESAHG